MACRNKRETVTLFGVIFPAMAEPPNPQLKWRTKYATGETDPWDHRIRDGELKVMRLVQKTECQRVVGSRKSVKLTRDGGGLVEGAKTESFSVIVELVNQRDNRMSEPICACTVKAKVGCKGGWAALNEGRANNGGCSCCIKKVSTKEESFAKSVAKV